MRVREERAALMTIAELAVTLFSLSAELRDLWHWIIQFGTDEESALFSRIPVRS